MMKSSHRLLLLLMVTLFFVGTGPASIYAAAYSGVVAFGDSLSDQGNTISYFPPPSWASTTEYDLNYYNAANNIYGIPAHGRWSDGPTWIEYFNGNLVNGAIGSAPVALGANYGIGFLSTDYSAGTNFAYGGSTTSTGSTDQVLHNLQLQISDYISLVGNSSSALYDAPISTTLYSIWSGGNDAIYWIESGSATSENAAAEAALSTANIQTALTTLYSAGARHFLVPNLPDLGKKPNFINTPNEALAADFVNAYNAQLDAIILGLSTTYTDISISLFDVHTQFDLILANPEEYGFLVTDQPAYVYTGGDPTSIIVPNPLDYIFWDSTHPTTQMHQILGNFAYMAVIPEPSEIALPFAGIAVLILLRRRSLSVKRRSGVWV